MFSGAEMEERHSRILAELSELCLSAARHLHTDLLAAKDADIAGRLGVAFHGVARSVRQTLALEARLERDCRRQDREDRERAHQEEEVRVATRKAHVRRVVRRVIWDEAEDDEVQRLVADLEDRLDEEALSDSFTDEAVEAHVARVRKALGLSQPAPPREDAEPGQGSVASAQDAQAADCIPALAGNCGGEGPADAGSEPDDDARERRSSA
jgi:hypothetical protein